MNDMSGQVVMVTGATNGIGEVTARELARMGATVIVVGRNPGKTERVVAEIRAVTGNNNVEPMVADLALMSEVRRLAEDFRARFDRLHVLVNNAGMMFTDREITAEGYERTFALNHLNYFLLTHLLLDVLQATGTGSAPARIINVSSDAHQMARISFDNLDGSKGYNAFNAYASSKLANIMFTYELARRLQQTGAPVTANALHPGLVNTGFGKNNGGFRGVVSKIVVTLVRPIQISAEQGARTSIYLASSPEVAGVTGKYFVKNKTKASSKASMNPEDWRRLWEISETMTGVKTTETA